MQDYWGKLTFLAKVRFVITLLIGIVGVIFATLNWKEEEVHLIFAVKKVPLSLLVILSIASGYAICSIFNGRKLKAKDDEIDELKKRLND
jgi:uncharacterized integral membrane protein